MHLLDIEHSQRLLIIYIFGTYYLLLFYKCDILCYFFQSTLVYIITGKKEDDGKIRW